MHVVKFDKTIHFLAFYFKHPLKKKVWKHCWWFVNKHYGNDLFKQMTIIPIFIYTTMIMNATYRIFCVLQGLSVSNVNSNHFSEWEKSHYIIPILVLFYMNSTHYVVTIAPFPMLLQLKDGGSMAFTELR